MIKRFGDSMRTDGVKLVTACRTTAAWEHLWTGWKHSDSSDIPPRVQVESGTGARHSSPKKTDDRRDQTIARLQSERDRAVNKLQKLGGKDDKWGKDWSSGGANLTPNRSSQEGHRGHGGGGKRARRSSGGDRK